MRLEEREDDREGCSGVGRAPERCRERLRDERRIQKRSGNVRGCDAEERQCAPHGRRRDPRARARKAVPESPHRGRAPRIAERVGAERLDRDGVEEEPEERGGEDASGRGFLDREVEEHGEDEVRPRASQLVERRSEELVGDREGEGNETGSPHGRLLAAGSPSGISASASRLASTAISIREASAIAAAAQAHGLSAIRSADTLEQAVSLAFENARPGDVVLLSPACASFDMFRNMAHRGEVFRRAVASIAEDSKPGGDR